MRSKRKNREEEPSLKTIGRILEALALPILIINSVLLNTENKNLPMISFLLGVGGCMFMAGVILSRLPQEKKEGKQRDVKAGAQGRDVELSGAFSTIWRIEENAISC